MGVLGAAHAAVQSPPHLPRRQLRCKEMRCTQGRHVGGPRREASCPQELMSLAPTSKTFLESLQKICSVTRVLAMRAAWGVVPTEAIYCLFSSSSDAVYSLQAVLPGNIADI